MMKASEQQVVAFVPYSFFRLSEGFLVQLVLLYLFERVQTLKIFLLIAILSLFKFSIIPKGYFKAWKEIFDVF